MSLKHGDEIALGSTRARFDDGSGDRARRCRRSGPGAVQHADPVVADRERDGAAFAAGHGGSAERAAADAPAGVLAADGAERPCPLRRSAHGAAVPCAPPAAPPAPRCRRPARRSVRPNLGGHAGRRARRGARHRHADRRADQGLPPLRRRSAHDTAAAPRSTTSACASRWELTRDIGLERDLDGLLDKILLALFKFTKADRGVILLRDERRHASPARRAPARRDATRPSRSARRS